MLVTEDTKIIDVPIFYSKFAVVDTKEKYDFIAEEGGIEDDIPSWGESFGCVYTVRGENGHDFHIISISDTSPGCVAHEALHLAVNIMDCKDIPISSDTEEVQAYLLGYIVDEVNRVINGQDDS